MKNNDHGNFFSLPNEIFLLALNADELAVYCYLRRCKISAGPVPKRLDRQ